MARELRNMYYVDGSTVRRVGYREAYPQERPAYPERPVHQPRKQPLTYRRVAIRAEKSLAFDLRYTLLLTAMFAIMIASCIVMLYVQGEVNSRERRITSLQQQIQTITADNAAFENNLNGMYSLEDIYKIAIGELGMVYSQNGQVVYYDGQMDDYVKQYSDIPGAK